MRQGAFKSSLEPSKARAGAVANYLAERGLPAGRLAVDGLADQPPLDPAAIEAARLRPWIELRSRPREGEALAPPARG